MQFCRGIGALKDGERGAAVNPNCWYWPPKGFPDGLYRDIMIQKTKYDYFYHIISIFRWIMMVKQIILGACLTALGSLSLSDGTAITILAAANTINAGILALMHNSGLPDRYRLDRDEYFEVFVYIKEIIDTRLVEADEDIAEIVAGCFSKFKQAKSTVSANDPATYTPSTVTSPPIGKRGTPAPRMAVSA